VSHFDDMPEAQPIPPGCFKKIVYYDSRYPSDKFDTIDELIKFKRFKDAVLIIDEMQIRGVFESEAEDIVRKLAKHWNVEI
jgi:hypothetical protein